MSAFFHSSGYAAPALLGRVRCWAKDELEAAGVNSPKVDAEELICALYGADSLFQVPMQMSAEELSEYEQMVNRRIGREPLQHITGRMFFRGLRLDAEPGIFIVRPETEWLTETATTDLKKAGIAPKYIYDLCSGSGAIGLSLARDFPNTQVIGFDIDHHAVSFALRQAERLKIPNYDCRLADVTDPTDRHLTDLAAAQLVISNPPYVPPGTAVSPEVAADPTVALWGGDGGGTEIPLAVLQVASGLLAAGGYLYMEHDETQAEAVSAAAARLGFPAFETLSDLNAKPRALRAIN
ncbi:MAG: HemK/PrmC family methyltransferase [Varibaculum sp.]|nr:HemK/PrmC family methyltransferase [Varibaculum sp.]